jgi:hypothetical protein
LTERRFQSADTDVKMGISKQGDAMERHYLYEAANVLLTTVKKRFALRSWGLKLIKNSGRSERAWRWRESSPSSWGVCGRIRAPSAMKRAWTRRVSARHVGCRSKACV